MSAHHPLILRRAASDGNTLAILLYSLVYFTYAIVVASTRPLWFDEIATSIIVGTPTVWGTWTALMARADVQPPLYYLLARPVALVVTDHELALRLPSVLGYWLMTMVLLRRASAIGGRAVGWVSVLLSLSTIQLATQARPYGLELGLAAVTLECYFLASAASARRWTVPGLSISLALICWVHYYGCLLALPLFTGEAVRIAKNRRPDWPIIVAVLLGLSSLVPLIPLIGAGSEFAGHFWAPQFRRFIVTSPNAWYFDGRHILLGFALLLLQERVVAGGTRQVELRSGALRPHERGTLIVVSLLPVVGFVASLPTGAFWPRYFVTFTIGIALLTASFVNRMVPWSTVRRLALIAPLAFIAARDGASDISRSQVLAARLDETLRSFEAQSVRGVPLVVARAFEFSQIAHYAGPNLASRVVFLTTREFEVAYEGFDSNFITLKGQQAVKPLSVSDPITFLRTTRTFLMWGMPKWWAAESRAFPELHLEQMSSIGGVPLYLVETRVPAGRPKRE